MNGSYRIVTEYWGKHVQGSRRLGEWSKYGEHAEIIIINPLYG